MTQATIRGTVGAQGANAPADVRVVQRLLATRAADLDLPPLQATGECDDATMRAIRAYQIRVAGDVRASGRLQPGDRVLAMLAENSPAARQREALRARRARAELSGAAWWEANAARFQDSRDIAALRPAFAASVTAFVHALTRAGAVATIEATRRNAKRAWLMRTAGEIARNAIDPGAVAPDPEVGILWNHGDPRRSQDAAEEMVAMFGASSAPAPDSPELAGNAVAMRVRWFDRVAVADARGDAVLLDRPRDGAAEPALHRVARSYGVIKAPTQPLLWTAAVG